MTFTLRQRHLIAAAMYFKKKRYFDFVSFMEIYEYGRKIQKLFNKSDLDVAVQNYSLLESIDSDSDMFEALEWNGVWYVICKKYTDVNEIQYILQGLPEDIYNFIIEHPPEI